MEGIINYLMEGRGEWNCQANSEREQICVGHWIYEKMLKCIQNRKQSMYIPLLIIVLCRQDDVSMSPIEPFTRPTRSVIRDNLYD
ncbi:hypothetical protein CXB51_028328 [Gossypium anomalum]|uniref:Uncharacterized protein n=1 Tax=Gossypium anomalum TaxID=47600 RepID=A0A8J5YII8_9ROSI|nr:hypothetical protein CXB51_028328 [Gossypium anomalum]